MSSPLTLGPTLAWSAVPNLAMAARRYAAKTPRYRRRYAKKKRSSKRPNRRTRRPRRTMTRRSVLNLTARKKRDTMTTYSTVGADPAQQGAIVLFGGSVSPTYGAFLIPWIATARTLEAPTNGDAYLRTSSTCYMRGLREQIRVYTSTDLPWEWRRICFTFKGPTLTGPSGSQFWLENSDGYQRLVRPLTAVNSTTSDLLTADRVINHVFEGTYGTDFHDLFTAKTENKMITVKYDRVSILRSGNAKGNIYSRKLWHPMNANLLYDDQERGSDMVPEYCSTEGKPGMGDYYVIDLFKPHPSASNTDRLTFGSQATLYWHEK